MPAADTVLLPICVALSLIGVLIIGVAWRRGRKGRLIQGVGVALAPVALYFTGLLRLVWDAVVAVVGWAARIVFSPTVWFGLSLLGLCVVLWIVGGVIAKRSPSEKQVAKQQARLEKRQAADGAKAKNSGAPAVGAGRPAAGQTAGRTAGQTAGRGKAGAAEVDPEMAEIEALLKSRGIN